MRRYFTHAIRDNAPLAAGMRLTMAGRIKVGPVWLAFTPELQFDGHEFAWRARAGWGPSKPLHVVDQYKAAAGSIDGGQMFRFALEARRHPAPALTRQLMADTQWSHRTPGVSSSASHHRPSHHLLTEGQCGCVIPSFTEAAVPPMS